MSDFFKDLSTWIPLIAVIVPLFVKVIKYYSVGESDFVYLTKGQQSLSYLAKLAVFFLAFWGLFFCEAMMIVQKQPDDPLPDSFFNLMCILFAISELVLMVGYAVFSFRRRALSAMQNKKGLNLAQNCCIICLLVVLMFLACLEYATIVLYLKENSQDLIKIVSFSFVMAFLYTLNIYFTSESLKIVENKRWYTIDDDSTDEGNPTNDRTTDVTLEKAEQTTDQSSRTEYVYRHSLQSKEGEATEETYAKYASMKQSRRR